MHNLCAVEGQCIQHSLYSIIFILFQKAVFTTPVRSHEYNNSLLWTVYISSLQPRLKNIFIWNMQFQFYIQFSMEN